MLFEDLETRKDGDDEQEGNEVPPGNEDAIAGPEAGIYTHEEGTVPGDDVGVGNAGQ